MVDQSMVVNVTKEVNTKKFQPVHRSTKRLNYVTIGNKYIFASDVVYNKSDKDASRKAYKLFPRFGSKQLSKKPYTVTEFKEVTVMNRRKRR